MHNLCFHCCSVSLPDTLTDTVEHQSSNRIYIYTRITDSANQHSPSITSINNHLVSQISDVTPSTWCSTISLRRSRCFNFQCSAQPTTATTAITATKIPMMLRIEFLDNPELSSKAEPLLAPVWLLLSGVARDAFVVVTVGRMVDAVLEVFCSS